jgi:monofunctional biosynthetic peptidoglycan transglycosylase
LTRRKSPSTGKASGSRRFWWWAALGVTAFALLIPILEVASVRWINPPVTPLMLLRRVEARFGSGHSTQCLYEWRNIGQMPRDFLRDVWIAEDQRFFQHHGFDWREIRLARQRSERTGDDPRGASTITMQCARSLFLWQGRSWVRKGLEAYYTIWMELLLSKRRIFELYANVIEMGDGVYGIEAAARAHYGVDARALSHNQCLMLAAILPNPREWDPRNPTSKLTARCQKISRQESSVHFPLSTDLKE